MPKSKHYVLEYLVDSNEFSKEELEKHVSNSLEKHIGKIKLDIKESDKYLILQIKSTEKYIDSCHDKLNFEPEWSYRTKDDLGELLRTKAYPILSKIELQLRNFVSQAMADVFQFNWWNTSAPKNTQERVKVIQKKSKENKYNLQHQIEYTFFNDLINFFTSKIQAWPDEKSITINDLSELLYECHSIEELQKKIIEKRKEICLWEDIFSKYFQDKAEWMNLKEEIEKYIIPVRNKVMHHRLIRLHEFHEVENFRDRLEKLHIPVKPSLSDAQRKEIQSDAKVIMDIFKSSYSPLKAESMDLIDPEILANIKSIHSLFKTEPMDLIDPEILANIKSIHSLFKTESMDLIDPEIRGMNSQKTKSLTEKKIRDDGDEIGKDIGNDQSGSENNSPSNTE